MIPTVKRFYSHSIPEDSSFWVPRGNEIGDEGFGYFRGTWAVGRPQLKEVRAILLAEAKLIDILDRIATDANTFEAAAAAIEEMVDDPLPVWIDKRDQRAIEDPQPFESMFGGLEIGVAGLVQALSAVPGIRTAASCRAIEVVLLGALDPSYTSPPTSRDASVSRSWQRDQVAVSLPMGAAPNFCASSVDRSEIRTGWPSS